MENFILPLFVAIFISLIMTPLVRKLAFRIGAMDIPKDDRRVHKEPMPLIGGLAIYISVMGSVLLFLPIDKPLFATIIGGTIIMISGIIDDMKGLNPKAKFLFQIIAASVLVWGGVRIEFITNPFSQNNLLLNLNWLSIPISIFWIVGITNTLNFIDGLDGLSCGVTMISSFSLMFVAAKFDNPSIMILSAIMAGACLGFLPYNFNPARIFMGDTGALFLGFMMGTISIEGVMKSVTTIAMIVPIIILGVPIFDTTFAILRRLLNGQSISTADKGHLHHRLLDKGYSQKKTVLILYGMSSIFGLFAVLVAKSNSKQAVYLSVVLIISAILFAIAVGLFGNKKGEEDHIEKD